MPIGDSRKEFRKRIDKRNNSFYTGIWGNKDLGEIWGDYDLYDLDNAEFYFPEKMFRLKKLPRVYFDPPMPVIINGKRAFKNNSGVFGLPSKMACLSFSLPAGPIKMYGTCPASGYAVDDPMFICNGCYALSGNYLRPSTIRKQQIVRAWCEQAVDDGVFAEQMIDLINHTFSLPKTPLRYKRDGKTFDHSTTRYFRLHDSGDFFNVDYYLAWCEIAEAFPNTLFWAPTRVALTRGNTVAKGWQREFSKAPDNLIIRPSSLYFEADPPDIAGMAMGSTASVEDIPGVHTCPAYKPDSGAKTCKDVGCRRCWTQPETAITYPIHGDDAKRIYSMEGYEVVRHNAAVAKGLIEYADLSED